LQVGNEVNTQEGEKEMEREKEKEKGAWIQLTGELRYSEVVDKTF
jgi:hypothetical protein